MKQQGYTLIELLITIFITGLFITMVGAIIFLMTSCDEIAQGAGGLAGEFQKGYESAGHNTPKVKPNEQ